MSNNDAISLDIDDGVASLVIERPPVNAFDDVLIKQLNRALDRVEQNADLSVLHIKSGLDVFSAGADLKLIRDRLATPEGRDSIIDVVRELQRVFARIEKLGVVSIAEIGGAAIGGGLELALCCDLRVVSKNAKLGLPEASLGLLPAAGGTQRLPRICGEASARRLILGAEIVNGSEAHRIGLVHWVVAAEELAQWTAALAARLGAMPAGALAACKRCIGAAADRSIDGFELELTETRGLHEDTAPMQRIQKVLKRSG